MFVFNLFNAKKNRSEKPSTIQDMFIRSTYRIYSNKYRSKISASPFRSQIK